ARRRGGEPMSTGTGPIGAAAPASVAPQGADAAQDARLRRACAELEGVFLNELMKLMRESVPEGGVVSGGAGEEIFASLFDQHVAVLAAERLERGLGAALYRSFRPETPAPPPRPETGTGAQ